MSTAVCGSWTLFRSRVPEGKPDEFIPTMGDDIARASRPIILNPGLVTMPLLVANIVPSEVSVLNLRDRDLNIGAIAKLVQDHDVFLLRPAPAGYYEPRKAEAAGIEQRLSQRLGAETLTCCLVKLAPRAHEGE